MKEACKLPLVFFGYLEYSKVACNINGLLVSIAYTFMVHILWFIWI